MKLYLLKIIPPFEPPYEATHGLLIRATSESEARAMADKKTYAEYTKTIYSKGGLQPNDRPWLDHGRTSCVEVLAEGKPEILLVDYQE